MVANQQDQIDLLDGRRRRLLKEYGDLRKEVVVHNSEMFERSRRLNTADPLWLRSYGQSTERNCEILADLMGRLRDTNDELRAMGAELPTDESTHF